MITSDKEDKIVKIIQSQKKRDRKKSKTDIEIEKHVKNILSDYKKFNALIKLNTEKKYISDTSLNTRFDNISFFVLIVETSLSLLDDSLNKLIQLKIFSDLQVQEQIDMLNISQSTYYTNWNKACRELNQQFSDFGLDKVEVKNL